MITRIYVDNYRCLSNFEFLPKRMNLLVGDNGSGKSTLVELLSSLCVFSQSQGAIGPVHFRADQFTRWATNPTQRFELIVELGGDCFDWRVGLTREPAGNGAPVGAPFEGQKVEVAFESVHCNGTLLAQFEPVKGLSVPAEMVSFPYALNSSVLAFPLRDAKLVRLQSYLRNMSVMRLDPEHIGGVSRQVEGFLLGDGTNFASRLLFTTETEPSRAESLRHDLAAAIGGFQSFDFERINPQTLNLMFRMRTDQGASYTIDFRELSPGQRALAVLYFVLRGVHGGERLLAFDEPDNFVSLAEIQPWLHLLSTFAEENQVQAFVISHNPEVIDYLAADTAWLFERDEGGPVRVRPLPIDSESGLKASEQLARGWVRGA